MSVVVEKELPKGWIKSPLGDLITPIKGKKPKKLGEQNKDFTIPYITISSFEKKVYTQFTNDDKCPQCDNEDVLIVWDGSRSGLVGTGVKGVIGSTLTKLNSHGLDQKYLFYFLQKNYLYINSNPKGIGIPHVNPNILWNLTFPLPPLNEQKRIVSKIEELFSLVDSAKDTLEKTLVLLKQYRQSILKHAFEGKLTEEWRKLFYNSESVKDILLKKSINNNKKKKTELDFSKLPKLPSNWEWVVFEQITENTPNAIKAGPFGSSLKKESYVNSGYKIYGQEQVLKNDPYYGDYYVNKKKFDELKSCQVKSGDLLISLVGTIGKTLLLPMDCENGIINPRLIKISLDNEIVNPRYIQQYFNSISARTFFKISSHGGTMEIINMGILKKLPIPFPHTVEQNEIISKIEESFSLIEKNEILIDQLLLQYKQIKNSILKQAFEGKLVPQDPNDEPAEVLLQRIREEKNGK